MLNHQQFSGVWVPALTPFRADLSVDREAFVSHCHWLLEEGVDGLAVFGTTSEANSLSLEERRKLLDELLQSGVPPDRLMPGVGCCALPDTVALCRHAAERGCGAVLMLPPFYYKGVSDDGLFAGFSWVMEQLAGEGLLVFLYHIPPVAQVPLSISLIARLVNAYPGRVAGVKDSGGDWGHTRGLLTTFPGLSVFAGSERFLLDTLRSGGAGSITASGNVSPAGIRQVFESWGRGEDLADTRQRRVTMLRDALEEFPMIPALKALCAQHYGNDVWLNVRPPLTSLTEQHRAQLRRLTADIGFSVKENRRFVLETG